MGVILGEHGGIAIIKLVVIETVNDVICASFSADLTVKEVK